MCASICAANQVVVKEVCLVLGWTAERPPGSADVRSDQRASGSAEAQQRGAGGRL